MKTTSAVASRCTARCGGVEILWQRGDSGNRRNGCGSATAPRRRRPARVPMDEGAPATSGRRGRPAAAGVQLDDTEVLVASAWSSSMRARRSDLGTRRTA
jgi:hypothetical protein